MAPAVSRCAWGVLAYNLLVILWGAYVRASGSGAGCGAHWPMCNGEVIPRSPTAQTFVEFTHRATSGVALLAVFALAAWVFRASSPKHPARRFAVWSVVFILLEAAIGAGLVLFELVAGDRSLARGYAIGAHLVNTFFLLGALTLTAFHAGAPEKAARPFTLLPTLGLVAIVATGVTGGIAALGDTLFPAQSLAHGWAQDLSAQSHLFLRLRISHPIVAVLSAAWLLYVATAMHREAAGQPRAQRIALVLGALVCAQVLLGLVNLALLAPVALQLMHLLLADLIWIALVLLGAAAGAEGSERVAAEARAPAAAAR